MTPWNYKEQIQMRAEELAWEIHNCEFYHLKDAIQLAIYDRALREVNEGLRQQADYLRDAEKYKDVK